MTERDRQGSVEEPERGPNWTTIALIAALLLLVLIVAYFATRDNADQDKLTEANLTTSAAPNREKLCASKATYELIKRDLFRRAAQLRGSDQAAFDRLSSYAVLRMENPVMESEDSSTGAVQCSGSLSLDLPPGVAVVGGRRTLSADVDYRVQQAADRSGPVVLLKNADAIVTPLATLARAAAGPSEPVPIPAPGPGEAGEPAAPAPVPPVASPPPAKPEANARPSFDCGKARSRSEIAVCSNAGLATLDRTMAADYRSALAAATPEQRALLQQTRDRFLLYRESCVTSACIGAAYAGRIREIRDILEDRWRPPR